MWYILAHVIHGLAAKPQAFRYSRLRDDLLPNDRYRHLWRVIDHALPAREACKWMVGALPTLNQLQARYLPPQPGHDVQIEQHALSNYDRLLSSQETVTVAEVQHG